jgi:hypothetical protein
MPKRTNEFQQLVALIQRSLADEGAVVTESALAPDGVANGREIDILIETKAGPYRIRIAVEAKDEGRPMDITKFESIVGKYFSEGGLKVNKVVVVTHRGFYEPVRDRARLLDVELFTVTEAEHLDWSQLRPPGPCFKSRIAIENILVRPSAMVPKDPLHEARVVCSCGRNYGTLLQFAHYLFWKTVVRNDHALLTDRDEQATQTSMATKAHVSLTLPHDHKAKLLHGGNIEVIDGLEFDVVFSKQEAPSLDFFGELQFRLAPHVCRIEVEPPLPAPITKQFLKEAHVVCSCCGKDHGSILEWSHDLMFRRVLPHRADIVAQFEERIKSEANGQAQMTLHWPFNKKWRLKLENNQYEAEKLLISIHAGIGTGKLECKQFEWTSSDGTSRRVSQLEATVAGKRLQFLMPEGIASKRIALRIDNAPVEKKAARKKRERTLRAVKRRRGKS